MSKLYRNSRAARLARALAWAAPLAALLVIAGRHAAGAAPATAVTDLGHGPVVVIVPDLASNRLAWMAVARRLIGSHRVVLVDLPGQGGTALPDPFGYAAAAAAIDSVLVTLPADSTVLIGHGAGAVVAAHVARAHPEHFRGLGLVDLPAKFPIAVPDAQRKLFAQWMADNYDALIARLYEAQGPDTVHGKDLFAAASLVPRATMTAYLRAALDLDVAPVLHGFGKPVLYVGSELRWPAERPWAELAAERGLDPSRVEAHRVPGCGRWIMKDQPDSLASAIDAFAAHALENPSTAGR